MYPKREYGRRATMEACQSGLSGHPAKVKHWKRCRGFESHRFRVTHFAVWLNGKGSGLQNRSQLNLCRFESGHRVENPGSVLVSEERPH